MVTDQSFDASPRVVHIGFGAFHRAHQLVYAQQTNELSSQKWGYSVISLFSTRDIKNIKEQDFEYHVIEQNQSERRIQKVTVVDEALSPAIDGHTSVIDRLAHASTKVITLTITEKGYGLSATSQGLNRNLPDVKHDIENIDEPRTALGYLVASLKQRRDTHGANVTFLSCDNLQQNGEILKQAILDFARAVDDSLASWVENHVAFPSSMVDRMVPAMSMQSTQRLFDTVGKIDLCGIACEPFRQWVLEDNFIASRPEWELAGATMVKDVKPYEHLKLRLLNASHSLIAYIGALANYDTVADAMANANIKSLVLHFLVSEQVPSLKSGQQPNIDTEAYINSILTRFENTELQHRNLQICQDGSQKLQQRLFEAIQYQLNTKNSIKIQSLCIALWLFYLQGKSDNNTHFSVSDPHLDLFREYQQESDTMDVFASKVISNPDLFPVALAKSAHFKESVLFYISKLESQGTLATVEGLVDETRKDLK